jgi:streptomycin 6-kinase
VSIFTKLTDALSMFWQALDDEERRVVIYLAAYTLASVALTMQRGSRERMKRELREEMLRGAVAVS